MQKKFTIKMGLRQQTLLQILDLVDRKATTSLCRPFATREMLLNVDHKLMTLSTKHPLSKIDASSLRHTTRQTPAGRSFNENHRAKPMKAFGSESWTLRALPENRMEMEYEAFPSGKKIVRVLDSYATE